MRPSRSAAIGIGIAAFAALGAACDRTVAPPATAARPVEVGSLTTTDALDVSRYVTDEWLAADPNAACAHGPIGDVGRPPVAGLRVVATRLPDGSLLRLRGSVGPRQMIGDYIEVVRDWPRAKGMRIATFQTSNDTVWVLRYGRSGTNRITDERPVADPEAATTLSRLQRQFAALACPRTLNRIVNYGDLVPLWELRERNGWEWRNDFPPRAGRAGRLRGRE